MAFLFGEATICAILAQCFMRRKSEKMNLDQWLRRRCLLKIFSYLELWPPFFQPSQNICAILVEGYKRNNSVKLF